MKKRLEHLCKRDQKLFISTTINKETKTIENVFLSISAFHKGDFEDSYHVINNQDISNFTTGKRMFAVLLFNTVNVEVFEIKKLNEISDIIENSELSFRDLKIINIEK